MAEQQSTRAKRKSRTGVVIKDKMHKGIVVWVERKLRHARYGKVIKVGKKYHVHDEKNEARADDIVEIMETRPISKLKRWRLVRILRREDSGDELRAAGGEA